MITIYRSTINKNSLIGTSYLEITEYNSLNDNIDFDAYIKKCIDNCIDPKSISLIYFIDNNIAVQYPDGFNCADDYITNKNLRRSYIKYKIDHQYNKIKRYDGYGLLNTSIPYEDTFRSEIDDDKLELYPIGTIIRFFKPDTNIILTGIIIDTSYDELRIYDIYCYEEDTIYNDDLESIHNNDILQIKGRDINKLKEIINKYNYMYDENYINEINNM